MSREVNMMHTHYPMHMGLHERPAQPCTRHPGGCPDQTQEHIAEAVAGIKDLVAKHNLQTQLDKMLRDVRALKLKRQREKQAMAQLRAEHPEQLVAPSVKKLEIYGRWVMSDAVLETLLTRVFRNVWQLNECLTSGYSMDAFVRVTQSMPWLERVKSINLFDPDSLSEGYKLQTARERTMRPPFLSDAANRVIYNFEPPHLQMIRGDGSGEPAKVDVEVEEATEVIFAD
ncbi:hypothetical protein BG003_003921 [Podila horticola]|nr:hypothetical protein BG003_003921 [Podila horticola]